MSPWNSDPRDQSHDLFVGNLPINVPLGQLKKHVLAALKGSGYNV